MNNVIITLRVWVCLDAHARAPVCRPRTKQWDCQSEWFITKMQTSRIMLVCFVTANTLAFCLFFCKHILGDLYNSELTYFKILCAPKKFWSGKGEVSMNESAFHHYNTGHRYSWKKGGYFTSWFWKIKVQDQGGTTGSAIWWGWRMTMEYVWPNDPMVRPEAEPERAVGPDSGWYSESSLKSYPLRALPPVT